MTITKDPPPDPIGVVFQNKDGGFRFDTSPEWRHWLNKLGPVVKGNISDASTSHAVDSWATTNTALDNLATIINSFHPHHCQTNICHNTQKVEKIMVSIQ